MKKVLSLVLVMAMILSSMSFAFAGTFEDVTGDYEKAIETLKGLGIVDGYDDGTYRPEKTVTRAEMAKLMVEILGYGDLVSGAKSNFTDTQGHWADAWIALAAGRNIVIGDGDGKFRPDATVTYNEVLTMVVRGLGYTDDSNEIKSMSWPTNFKVKAAELRITDGVGMNTTGADRGGVAQALYNALKATLVTVDTDGNVTNLKDANNNYVALLSRIAQKVDNTPATDNDRAEFKVNPNHLNASHKDYAGNIIDLTPYMYQTVEAYASKTNAKTIVYVGEVYSDTVEGTFIVDSDTVSGNGEIQVKLADGSVEDISINSATNIPVFYNGSATTMKEADMEDNIDDGSVVGLDDAKVTVVLDEYDDVEAIVAKNPTFAARINRVYKDGATKLGRIELPLKGDKVDLSKVTVTGAVDDIKDIEIDDIVVAYAGKGIDNDDSNIGTVKVELVVVRDTVEGKVTKVNKIDTTSATIYIDGVKYSKSATDGQVDIFDVGNEGTFFLDSDGKIFAKEASTVNNAKDYAVVIDVYAGQFATDGVRVLVAPEVKLINAAGEVVTYEVSEDAYYQGGTNTSSDMVFDDTTLVFNDDAANKVLDSSALIKYKLDSKGLITRVEIVMENAGDVSNPANYTTMDTTKASFDVAEDAPIFNIKVNGSNNKNNYSVVEASDVPSSIKVTHFEVNDNGEYKVLVATDADTSTGTYALIKSVNFILNDDDVKVAEITAMVKGVEVVYEAKAGVTVTSAAINKGTISELELEGGKVKTSITGVESPVVPAAGSYVGGVSASRILVKTATTDGTWELFNVKDVVVYVINNDGEFVEVEEIDNIVGYDVVGLYNTNPTESGYEIIVIR